MLDRDRLIKKLLLDYFLSRNRKFKHYCKPLLIIDRENHSGSKLFTLNCKQTLCRCGTVLACPIIVSFRERAQLAHFLLQVVARVNQVVPSVYVLVAQGV